MTGLFRSLSLHKEHFFSFPFEMLRACQAMLAREDFKIATNSYHLLTSSHTEQQASESSRLHLYDWRVLQQHQKWTRQTDMWRAEDSAGESAQVHAINQEHTHTHPLTQYRNVIHFSTYPRQTLTVYQNLFKMQNDVLLIQYTSNICPAKKGLPSSLYHQANYLFSSAEYSRMKFCRWWVSVREGAMAARNGKYCSAGSHLWKASKTKTKQKALLYRQLWFCGEHYSGSEFFIWGDDDVLHLVTPKIPSLHFLSASSNISIFVCCHDIILKTLRRRVLQISPLFSCVWIFSLSLRALNESFWTPCIFNGLCNSAVFANV